MKFIHLTDTHFVPAPRRLYALDPRERLRLAIADINRRHADAAFAVVTGDLAHFGEPDAYRDLKAELDQLSIPVHLAIGNHDSREAFQAVFPEVPRNEDGFVQYVVETPVADCVILDSVMPRQDGGTLCAARLAWLDRVMAERADRDLWLFLHHSPLDIGIPCLDTIRLMNAEDLWRRAQRHGRVRHIFFGHVHRPISGVWRGIPFFTPPATAHQTELQYVERVLTPGTHEPPAYAVVLADADSVVVHLHAYLDNSARFIMDYKSAESARTLKELALAGPG